MSTLQDRFVDPDIERAYNWFLSFLPAGEWTARKAAIEQHLEAIFKPKKSRAEATDYYRLVGTEDRIGWYLYLVEMSLYEPYRTEVNQAARVLPVFSRLGSELDLLLKIGGVEEKAVEILNGSKTQPDSVLFEMLIALLWARNGWQDVAFIPADPRVKRPDIRAATGAEEWFVETKRMTTNSAYSQKERDKWLRMWGRLKDTLIDSRLPLVLDITFHVELETLDDDFARDHLAGKLKLVVCPCELISNEYWTVSVNFVDFDKIRKHFEKFYVKSHSRQLQELVGGRWERGRGFTMVMNGSTVRMGEGRVINEYVENIHWAAGAYWHCDAERAFEKKARDIRSHLADAVEQLPVNGRGVIHVGLETFDGEFVEAERFERILRTTAMFDPTGKDLRWVYCHLYEAYAPPDKAWYFDETIYQFGANKSPNLEPITQRASVVPNEEGAESGPHWLREAP
ncbi:MAG: hypothetical protein HYS12_09030 [Planctomycetes bacterium]|nr:hypothetical protein [Planctomycetota bacterium]